MRQYFFTGTAAPTITPPFAGSLFTDTTTGKVYFGTGTSTSADWDVMPSNLSELVQDADHSLAGLYKIKKALGLDFQPSLEATLVTGVMTQVQSLHSVDTESDAASDDLDTITPLVDMNFMLLKLEDSARVVTLKHGTGNLLLPNDADVVMKENVLYLLVYNGADWNLMLDPASINTGASNAWTAQQYFVEQTLVDGANISWDLDAEQTATVTLTGNRILDNPTNLKAGGTYILRVVQDGVGTRTLTYGSAYKFSGGAAPTLSTGIGAVDLLTFYSDGTNMNGTFVGDFS